MATITIEEISLFYAELGSKGQKSISTNCLVCRSKSLFKNVK